MFTTTKGTAISNDGATILKLLDIEHAAAKILVELQKIKTAKLEMGMFINLAQLHINLAQLHINLAQLQ
jgi:hypothetical protein